MRLVLLKRLCVALIHTAGCFQSSTLQPFINDATHAQSDIPPTGPHHASLCLQHLGIFSNFTAIFTFLSSRGLCKLLFTSCCPCAAHMRRQSQRCHLTSFSMLSLRGTRQYLFHSRRTRDAAVDLNTGYLRSRRDLKDYVIFRTERFLFGAKKSLLCSEWGVLSL